MSTEESDLSAFEQWAVSKGYDISLSMTPTKEGNVTYGNPETLAAYEGWLAGFMVGWRQPKRFPKKNVKIAPKYKE